MLAGKTVFVCGAGPGLGREVALAALREGARVALAARNESRLNSLAKELGAGNRVLVAPLDLTDAVAIESALARTEETFGRIDALVQVASLHVMGDVADTRADQWRDAYDTNVVGTVELVNAVAPRMKAQGGGSIVIIGSQAAVKPGVPEAAYAACKGALLTTMLYLAKELGPDGIRVNTVAPTWMMGPVLEGFFAGESKRSGTPVEDLVAGITSQLPLRRIPSDGDVAESVVFFCSDRARMITGQSLLVNAGEHMP